VDLEAFEQLLTPAGQDLLAEASSSYDSTQALAVATRLRARHPAALVAAALTQVELRQRGRAKFGAAADALYFTPDGLEQATHPVVAGHRASRLVAGLDLPQARAAAASLVDLGCGIGSDLLAFARAGLAAAGVERDPLTAAVAGANLAAFDVEVSVADALEVDRSAYDVTFVDPARRGAAGRTFDLASYAPSWSFVEEVLAAAAVVKVAPGIPHDVVPDGVEADWVSLDGALKEATLWSVGAARVSRRASVLTSGGSAMTLTDQDAAVEAHVAAPGGYLYEPDDAVIRAHLVTTVAALVDGWLLDEHLAYVSSDRLVATPFAAAYEVLDVLPFQEKRLRAALRARDIGPLTIKKRGISVTPEALRARLGLTGSTPATIVLTRTPSSAAALLVHPLSAEEPPSAPI
jgi:SAM-dependent methyltransferase